MDDSFKIWSETNSRAKENISSKLGLREWDELDEGIKKKVLRYFTNERWFGSDYNYLIAKTILTLNNMYKNKSYGINLLNHGSKHDGLQYFYECCDKAAIGDFTIIFLSEKQDVVYEMLTIYADYLIEKRYLNKLDDFSDPDDREERKNKAFRTFDAFAYYFNDITEQFGINIILTRNGLTFRQDEKISKEIFEPVLNFLSDPQWEPVNRDLRDAFSDYQVKSDQGYSSCVTHAISALQGYLQLTVHGEAGKKGEISSLIVNARKNGLIPNDKFTEQIFKNIESILMYERQQTGDPHPKKEYATEKNARLILNLIMIFLQHCIQN